MREENIAEKVKKKNKIKIKERSRSLFYTTFRREERRRYLNLGERKNSSKRRKKRESSRERAFSSFILLFSWAPFPLTGLQSPYFGQPIKPFKTSISEYLAILPLL